MICNCNGIHPQSSGLLQHLINPDSSIQEAVFGVDMKVNKRRMIGHFILDFVWVSQRIYYRNTLALCSCRSDLIVSFLPEADRKWSNLNGAAFWKKLNSYLLPIVR
jgi:hypothetical protein